MPGTPRGGTAVLGRDVDVMRLRMALIGLLVAALPLAGPVPSQAKPKAPGRTIIVQVSGLPKGTKAKITVKGPKKYHKTVKTATTKKLARLRPGKYRISAGKVTTGSGRTLTPKVHPRKGKVTQRKGLRVKITYSSAAEPEPGQDGDHPSARAVPGNVVTDVDRSRVRQPERCGGRSQLHVAVVVP